MISQETRTRIRAIVQNLFKDSEGKPFPITDGECEIFEAVTNPHYKYDWISAPTRYGKTETIALAIIYLAVFHHLKVPVVAGSYDKANKIMEYVVAHLGDHPSLYKELINAQGMSSIDKLKVTVSKSILRWSSGGWLYITSVQAGNIKSEGESVVGEGGDVIVLEEAGLIKHQEQFSKIVRMSESNKGWGKLVLSGNCIEKSIFEEAFGDPMYHKVRISLEQAIAEGRYSPLELEQKKLQTTSKDWKRYYLVEFPLANEFTYFKPQRYEILPGNIKNYAFLDLALGESAKGSLVAVVILGRDPKGQVYEVHSFGLILKPEETIREVFNLPYKFERFGIESVGFQKFFYSTINDLSKKLEKYIPFTPISQSRPKMERIEGMEPIVNTGQILFKGDGEMWKELSDYPNCEKFDVLDSLEGAWRVMGGSGFEFAVV